MAGEKEDTMFGRGSFVESMDAAMNPHPKCIQLGLTFAHIL